MNKKKKFATFLWRVTAIHTIAYFLAGIFALIFMNYKELFAAEVMSIMRPINSPWVAAGPGLQIIRGIIIAIVLYPFQEIFFNTKNGWLKLWLLILGLSYFSTIGPTFGSFEGYVYTKVAIPYHLLGIPETLLYTFLFSFFICFWYKKPTKVWNISTTILVLLIIVMSALGLLSSLGVLPS
ncbi:hypothetical protein WKV44_10135 [Spirochaetia bacterium 38H-sp]|uniref:Uncharacterized protein n=1 Tax=Rarispira pelagica TaxID=3141764 RepID=A0ABU9UE01_9SPIR